MDALDLLKEHEETADYFGLAADLARERAAQREALAAAEVYCEPAEVTREHLLAALRDLCEELPRDESDYEAAPLLWVAVTYARRLIGRAGG